MQTAQRQPSQQQAPVKIYNAVYSSVQVRHAPSMRIYPPHLAVTSGVGLRMYGPRYRCHAEAGRLLRERDSDS